jgi:hypothetical protein
LPDFGQEEAEKWDGLARTRQPVPVGIRTVDREGARCGRGIRSQIDGHHDPVTVAGSVPWQCNLGADKLRVPEGNGEDPGSGGNEAPKASVRVNLLTRDTGKPSSVLLDGSGSTDSDGTIASYTFQAVAKPSGQVAFGPVTGAAAFAMTTLPPGDYAAIVVATDNLGAQSAPASRTFSIK